MHRSRRKQIRKQERLKKLLNQRLSKERVQHVGRSDAKIETGMLSHDDAELAVTRLGKLAGRHLRNLR